MIGNAGHGGEYLYPRAPPQGSTSGLHLSTQLTLLASSQIVWNSSILILLANEAWYLASRTVGPSHLSRTPIQALVYKILKGSADNRNCSWAISGDDLSARAVM